MGVPLTYVDGNGPLTTWFFTGEDGIITDLRYAYMDGVLVFEKTLNLTLPCNPSYNNLNLKDFIDARNQDGYYMINVLLPKCSGSCSTCNCHHPTIETGDLSKLYVTLTIDGCLEAGWSSAPAALSITSPLILKNNGRILGYGGRGGNGGRGNTGPSGTTSTTDPFTYGGSYYWDVSCTPCHNSPNTTVLFKWGGSGGTVANCATCPGPSSHKSGSCTYTRGSVQSGSISDCAGGNTHARCSISRKCTTSTAGGAGGGGGDGGDGQWYKHAAEPGEGGDPGAPGSNPPGTTGDTGGTGGHGGTWGKAGGKGVGGSNGSSGGKAIIGSSHIKNSDWNNGNVEGGVQ